MKKILMITFCVVLILLTVYRYSYGIWNPFVLPDRISCYGRRYYMALRKPQIEKIDKEKLYEIKSLNILTGKRLYTTRPNTKRGDFIAGIYLETGIDEFQAYSIAGGP